MCGRISQASALPKTREFLQIQNPLELPPRYNVAPSLPLAIVRADPNDGHQWALARWGLIPHWAKDLNLSYKMINAKAETVAEKPAYRGPFRYRRCVIPADGFYEWKTEGKLKQPYYIKFQNDDPLLLAGLWDLWEGQGHALESCTIVTTEGNALMKSIHDRMPVILPHEAVATWLDPRQQDKTVLLQLLKPYPAETMVAYKVDKRVNKPAFDEAACVEPLPDSP